MRNWKDITCGILLAIGLGLFFLSVAFIVFGLVPVMVETAVANNWNDLGKDNRWFYFFYFLTLGCGFNIKFVINN